MCVFVCTHHFLTIHRVKVMVIHKVKVMVYEMNDYWLNVYSLFFFFLLTCYIYLQVKSISAARLAGGKRCYQKIAIQQFNSPEVESICNLGMNSNNKSNKRLLEYTINFICEHSTQQSYFFFVIMMMMVIAIIWELKFERELLRGVIFIVYKAVWKVHINFA